MAGDAGRSVLRRDPMRGMQHANILGCEGRAVIAA